MTHYAPLATPVKYEAIFEAGRCRVISDQGTVLEASVETQNGIVKITGDSPEDSFLLGVMIEHILGVHPELKEVQLNMDWPLGPFQVLGKNFLRSEFFQLPALWSHQTSYTIKPERWTETNGRTHPVREAYKQGPWYRRFVPQLGKTISFRMIEAADLDIFHEWHNQPRVSVFWELNQSKEELKAYMEKGLKDPHQVPLIVEIDGEPVGYFEMYWVREDRLGPYYESDAFDRGFHFLIGNRKFLGYATTDAITKSCLHLLFLDDPRTRRVMAEPRHDNHKVLKYAEASIGWRKVKIFDFPHKRAWLLENSREVFFGGAL